MPCPRDITAMLVHTNLGPYQFWSIPLLTQVASAGWNPIYFVRSNAAMEAVMSRGVRSLRKVAARSGAAGLAGLAATAVVMTTSAAGATPHHPSGGGVIEATGGVAFIHDIAWTATSPARGVTVLSGSYHNPDSHPYWTVLVQAPTVNPFTGDAELAEAGSAQWATQTEAALQSLGYTPTATVLPWPDYVDTPHGVMGTRVRVGQFATQADAKPLATALTSAGFAPLVEWTGFDASPAPDAELLHAVIVDPRTFDGQVIADHGSAIGSRQSAPDASAALGSLVSTNAGFFTIDTHWAQLGPVAGVNTGISVYDGRLESLANGDRAALIFGSHEPARVENLTTSATLTAGNRSIRILGLNRLPGSAEDCGVAGLAPTSEPRQNSLCTGTNDLVLFTPEFGAPLPAAVAPATTADAVQVVLDTRDRVISIGQVGTTASLPAGQSAIQAIGTQAAWIRANLHVGDRVAINEQIRTDAGQRVALTPTTSIVSAGSRLLRNGHTWINAVDEGILDPRDLNDYTFSAYRHARTIAGVDAHGRIILATVDGVPGVSEGLTLDEEAALMRSLGAVDALNLDGGGSTEFAANGQLVDVVNDSSGSPRRIGGTIDVVPNHCAKQHAGHTN